MFISFFSRRNFRININYPQIYLLYPQLSTILSPYQPVIGFTAALVFSLLAWRSRALNLSGAVAAAFVGGSIFAFGGLPWAVLLLVFFITSSLLSRFSRTLKISARIQFAKGSRRDWAQVLANGGLPAALALLIIFVPDLQGLWVAYCSALAAVNADTWSTELGILNPEPPRLITTGKPVDAGTSGGISLYGSLAAVSGALLVGIFAGLFNPIDGHSISGVSLANIVFLAGLFGAMLDSLLGASIQGVYYCPACRKETELRPDHSCGTTTIQLRGWRWLNNDLVNFLSSLAGAIAGYSLLLIIDQRLG